MTQYGIRPPSLKPVTTSSSSSSTTPNGDAGRATETVGGGAGLTVPREQRVEVDVDQLVAVQREDVAALRALLRGELDPAAAAEPLGLLGADDLDPEPAELSRKTSPWPAAHETITRVDAGVREPADLVRDQRLSGDVDERLRPAARRVAHALGLAAREDDRLHRRSARRKRRLGSGVSGNVANGEAARPIPS